MTISYTGDVANASGFGCFNKILFKWRGSVYKLIFKELLAYLSLYYIINLIYREVLVKNSECETCTKWQESREMFEALRTYCHEQLTSIPLTFVLGFYVTLIVDRWWKQYTLLPWPDSMAMLTVSFLTGKEDRQRLMRRSIVRYILLSYCMAMRTVSFRVKKRFPDLTHLVDAGYLREDELKVIYELDTKVSANKWFLPLTWACDIVTRGLSEGNIRPQTVRALMAEIVNYRNNLTEIVNYDWVSVPLVYTQVVTLAVYSYFAAALIGAQWISPAADQSYKTAYNLPIGTAGGRLDLYYPIFLTVQFIFFFGWLKVAETLINPFGEDDDDFELNRLIDRHTQVGYLIVENVDAPELLKDRYWDDCIPKEIPYTVGAEKFKKEEFQGSAECALSIKDSDKEYGYVYNIRRPTSTNPPSRNEVAPLDPVYGESFGEYGDYESVGTPMVGKRFSWIKKKMGRLDSIRSNKSISSGSTYIGHTLSKKSHHKSQLSLYEKITRKMSVFDTSKDKNESRSRKSSRQSNKEKFVHKDSLKLNTSQDLSGTENESFEKAEEELVDNDIYNDDDDRQYIIDKKFLETITENQNSPYSTQASYNTSRRMSAQSIFTDGGRRGSLAKEYGGPVLELFHEEEERVRSRTSWTTDPRNRSRGSRSGSGSLSGEEQGGSRGSWAPEELGDRIEVDGWVSKERVGRREEERRDSIISQSLSGSHRSRESGVGSMGGDTGSLDHQPSKPDKSRVEAVLGAHHPLVVKLPPSQPEPESPSPMLPKRKAVMSLDKIDSESYEISPLATSEQAVNLPARRGTPVAGLPARQGTPVAGLPARQGTPVAGLPARQGTPVTGLPANQGTPVTGLPARQGTPVDGLPARQGTPVPHVHDVAAASPLSRVPVVVAAPVPAVAPPHRSSDTIQTPAKKEEERPVVDQDIDSPFSNFGTVYV